MGRFDTMKTPALLLLTFLAACATSGGVASDPGSIDPDPGPPAVVADHPKLVFTADGHDYGRLEKRTKIAHTAVFYNAGSAPLEIRQVKTHCGCAAALLSGNRIPPGGRGTLRITLDTGMVPGTRTKTVEVVTNDPTDPVATYRITCDVIADAAVDPLMLVVRGARGAGPIETGFDVYTMRPGFPLEIRDVRPSHDGIRATVTPLPPGGPRVGYRVNLTLLGSLPGGDLYERILVVTNSKRDARLSVTLIGTVAQSVVAVPERLYLPAPRGSEVLTRRVFVSRPDGRPLTVTGVEDPAGVFEVEHRQVDPSKVELTVVLAGEAPAETLRGSLLVRTDDPDEPIVAVPYEIAGPGR